MDDQVSEKIYRTALNREVCVDCMEKLIIKYNGVYRKLGNGRGLVGATAAVSWKGVKHTYELISYKYPHPVQINKKVKNEIANIAEKYSSTFNNLEKDEDVISLFPKERTPVIYGIRSKNSENLRKIQMEIGKLYPEYNENFLIYKTNQGTDDHIIPFKGGQLQDLSSYLLTGRIVKAPSRNVGGHLHFSMSVNGEVCNCIVFEPSKKFRNNVESLRVNDFIQAYGSFGNESLKIEKIRVLEFSEIYERKTPKCKNCGTNMRNVGNRKFKCRKCETISDPVFVKVDRSIKQKMMEPPVYARRHLSMPWKLEGEALDEP